MKKLITTTLLILLVLLTSCSNNKLNPNPTDVDSIIIDSQGTFTQEQCTERNLQDKVIMIKSKYCGHCVETLPDFKKAASFHNLDPMIIETTKDEDLEILKSYNIDFVYTPTFIVGCDYFIGAKSFQGYDRIFEDFKESQTN
ncbi:thioredoxin family protein [Candidatus Woesearchaeota archaeon]|jgi:thiol-disulfide isomerase/thioredoxin|nr:thioredoxin family protein [archaeon]MBT6518215.1 thioredoxin family protein [Candidatus Woesearchaeota archaeon]MBT7368516.1 thioredoxin family protein [Candidatus Woesearchaeota archaeon]